MMDRREFLLGVGATSVLGGCAWRRAAGEYSVAILGDTHYDAESADAYHRVFRTKIDPVKTPWYPREFARNGFLWGKGGPSRGVLAASAKCVTDDTRFLLQMGDLVQGDCDTAELHRRMLGEMADCLEAIYPKGLPVLATCGNHDVRAGGAFDVHAAYRAFAEEWRAKRFHARRGETPQRGTTFAFAQGPDAFLVVDFNHPDLAHLKRLLDETKGARHTFVCIHGPVLPMSHWRDRFFYLSGEGENEARREARRLLARREAIVLAGHEHTLAHRDWQGDGGRITEFIFNSVYGESLDKLYPAVPKPLYTKPAEFGRALEKAVTPRDVALRDLYREYRPGLQTHFVARAVGHYRLNVAETRVTVDYYGRTATTPTRTFVLRV